MVHAKNYETMSTFVKVLQKKLLPLFFRTPCTTLTVTRLKNSTVHYTQYYAVIA